MGRVFDNSPSTSTTHPHSILMCCTGAWLANPQIPSRGEARERQGERCTCHLFHGDTSLLHIFDHDFRDVDVGDVCDAILVHITAQACNHPERIRRVGISNETNSEGVLELPHPTFSTLSSGITLQSMIVLNFPSYRWYQSNVSLLLTTAHRTDHRLWRCGGANIAHSHC